MNEAEMKLIVSFAKGQKALRDQAIAIYRKYVHEWVNRGNPRCPYMSFMSEIDNPCPDLSMRSRYRTALVELIL